VSWGCHWRLDGVVPVAVKLVAVERHCCELFVADLDAGALAARPRL
jgi:hypothetical protein